MVGRSMSHAIENVYYVKGLKHNLLNISQMCDKGNNVLFTSADCKVTSTTSRNLVLREVRHKNVYKANILDPIGEELSCLSATLDNSLLWHKLMGHASFSHLNRLVRKELVMGLPKTKFNESVICDACAKGKHVKSSFKPKKMVSSSKCLQLLHTDLCDPMRVTSGGEKKYVCDS